MRSDLLSALAEELLEVIRSNSVITYGDLSRRFRDRYGEEVSPRAWRAPLGDLSGICMDNGFPAISVVVVNKDTGLPGEGFFDFVGRHRTGALVPANQWEAFWEEQKRLAYTWDQWARLPALLSETKKGRRQLED